MFLALDKRELKINELTYLFTFTSLNKLLKYIMLYEGVYLNALVVLCVSCINLLILQYVHAGKFYDPLRFMPHRRKQTFK